MSDHDDHDDHGLGTPPDAATAAALATPERREDGPGKVTGATRFAGDRRMPGTLWAAFLNSQVPHGTIRSIDVSVARTMPGVRAVLTGADIEGVRFGRRLQDRPVLAWNRVLFVGDRLAAVAADTLEQAEAAIDAIEVDIEELEPLFDMESAALDAAPVLHPDADGYAYIGGTRPPVAHPNVQGRTLKKRGEEDIEAVFAGAAHVFEHEFTTPRQHSGYIEPHATLVWIDEADVVHVVTTNKTPFLLRGQMAKAIGLPPAQIEIQAGAIGGDFGGKGYSIDEFACYFLAKATGRPVRTVTRYAEELSAVNVRHAARLRLKTAVDADGRMIAHRADILFDGGAYAGAKPLPHLMLGSGNATMSPYRIPNVLIEGRTIYTNTVPAGHMRSPGEVQALFAGESHLDEIARELGIDPIEFRLRNVVRDGEVGTLGDHFREARGAEVLERVRTEMDWDRPLPAGRGRGLAFGVRHVGGGAISLGLRLGPDGRIEVLTGLPDQGGGQTTVIKRVLALVASVDESRISVIRRTTAGAPMDPGVGGSRVTHIASRAAEMLGHQLRDWIDERLPRAIPDAPSGATLRDDAIVDGADGRVLLGFDELTARLVPAGELVELDATFDAGTHGPDDPGDNDFAACAVEVSVDPDTGTIAILDAVFVLDVGTIINPVAHAGQIDGGFAFGVGAALMEELIVEDGVMAGLSLGETRLPTIRDVPALRQVLLPTTVGPGAFGAKMAGELSNAPVAPAIANAVADAIGIRPRDLPLTPERILAAIRARAGARANPGS
ncbi:MAG: xanthine dehydrogenase family protein molybdopterin-binding subunit [Candidatus Limnocylindrales bacterium]